MDGKTCVWRKRYSNKSIAVNDEAEVSVKENEEEKLMHEKKAALVEIVNNLHEQVACLLCECYAKDKLVAEHAKTAQEATTGRERAEAEVAKRNQELEHVSRQKLAANGKLVHLNAALKSCRQQLISAKVEQERMVHLERAHKRLELKYTEARKKLANLTVENARLTKLLSKKEGIIKDVSNQMSDANAEFNSLVSRLNSTERGNHVLKYEYRVLKRELKMRNHHTNVENRQHQESAKRVAKLEAERQKLRLLARKRIPGHTNMKPRKAVDRRTSLIINQLREVEQEKRTLRESACQRESEICLLKAELARIRCDEQYKRTATSEMKHVDTDMEAKLLESEKKIASLKLEVERLIELKRMYEDHFENLKLINVDLDHQLFSAKLQIKEALRSVSFLEMELEDRSHHCEGLEAACLELQFQLASVSCKDKLAEETDDERKLFKTGSEITSELTNKKLSQYSLRDHMAAEDGSDRNDLLNSPMIKETVRTTETEQPSIPCYNTCNTSHGVKNDVPRTLPIVPRKKQGKGGELLRKLLFRRKIGGKMRLFALLRAMQI